VGLLWYNINVELYYKGVCRVKSNTPNTVMYFQNEEAKNISNQLVAYAVVSKAVKCNNHSIRYENWKARFVGSACQKSKQIKNKSKIVITNWEITNECVDGLYDYFMIVYDFDLKER